MVERSGKFPQTECGAALDRSQRNTEPGSNLCLSVVAPVGEFENVALLAIILSNNEIPVLYLYALWLGPTVMQGSCDPTNSWTLWTIGYTKVPHGQFLKTAMPFGCLMVVVTSAICYYMFG